MPGLTVVPPGSQESQQLFEPPEPLGPLTLPQWDEDQQLGDLKELLSLLCGLLLEEGHPSRVPAKAADAGPVGKANPNPPYLSGPSCFSQERQRRSGVSPAGLHIHSPNTALFPRGPAAPGTGPKHTHAVSAEEGTLAE